MIDCSVLSVELGDWDLRSAVLRGIQRRLGNYLIYAVESGLRSILKAQNNGLNVTRALILTDMNGFSVRQHACPACLAILIRWSIILESYYPKFTEEIIILNGKVYR
ncbi:unnamed protein product [Orchesella dallaii]|uniref:CRAL-TRIO domain-containing protein n=1 Tax=Orchesella dallaii TaxID=48710 RepID=A0ABP1PY19_9HEXA